MMSRCVKHPHLCWFQTETSHLCEGGCKCQCLAASTCDLTIWCTHFFLNILLLASPAKRGPGDSTPAGKRTPQARMSKALAGGFSPRLELPELSSSHKSISFCTESKRYKSWGARVGKILASLWAKGTNFWDAMPWSAKLVSKQMPSESNRQCSWELRWARKPGSDDRCLDRRDPCFSPRRMEQA